MASRDIILISNFIQTRPSATGLKQVDGKRKNRCLFLYILQIEVIK